MTFCVSGNLNFLALYVSDISHVCNSQPQSAEKLMKKLVTLYETKEDDLSRSAVALTLKSVSKAKIEHIKDNEAILAPMVFLAMHGPKDEGEYFFMNNFSVKLAPQELY